MPNQVVARWRLSQERATNPECKAAFGQVVKWFVLHERALQASAMATRIGDGISRACFAEMARIEGELATVNGCAELGEAKVLMLLANYDIGGRDYSDRLADPTLKLMLSAADDLRPMITQRILAAE